jgi:hypothetical protein
VPLLCPGPLSNRDFLCVHPLCIDQLEPTGDQYLSICDPNRLTRSVDQPAVFTTLKTHEHTARWMNSVLGLFS